jgi:hypothetical protein
MAHAGKLVQLRARAALRHGLRGGRRQQVGVGAAQQQRRALQAVVACHSSASPGLGQSRA